MRIREWLYNEFLPKETKEIYMRERDLLRGEIARLTQENERLKSYIDGVHDVIRQRMRIEINNEVSK